METFLFYFTPIHLFSLYCFLKCISFLIFYNLNHGYSNLGSYHAISKKLYWVTPAFISFFFFSSNVCCCCSFAQSCLTLRHPMTAACQASLSLTVSRVTLKRVSIESVMPSNHLILCRPLLLLPSIFPSIRVFSNESALRIRWPKYWSFSFSISPSNEHPGLISFRMDWLVPYIKLVYICPDLGYWCT